MSFLEKLLKSNYYKEISQLPEWLLHKESFSNQIRSIRNILGMTQDQLARRASQNPRLIRRLEADKRADPQLSTLMKTAEGLGCELIIRFIPKKSIPGLLKERAYEKAKKMVMLSKGSSAIEEQQPEDIFVQFQINELANELLKKPSSLWDFP